MSDFVVNFEWYRAPRYDLHPYEDGDGFRQLSELGKPWPPGVLNKYLGLIVPGGAPKKFKPQPATLDKAIEVLLGIANRKEPGAKVASIVKPHLEAAVPKLAQAIGMLYRESRPGDSEGLGLWYALAQCLRLLQTSSGESEIIGGDLKIFLVSDSGKHRIVLRPSNMFNLVMIHAAQSMVGGASFRQCESCGLPFVAGGTRAKGRRRGDARFCSTKCKADFHNAQARKY